MVALVVFVRFPLFLFNYVFDWAVVVALVSRSCSHLNRVAPFFWFITVGCLFEFLMLLLMLFLSLASLLLSDFLYVACLVATRLLVYCNNLEFSVRPGSLNELLELRTVATSLSLKAQTTMYYRTAEGSRCMIMLIRPCIRQIWENCGGAVARYFWPIFREVATCYN